MTASGSPERYVQVDNSTGVVVKVRPRTKKVYKSKHKRDRSTASARDDESMSVSDSGEPATNVTPVKPSKANKRAVPSLTSPVKPISSGHSRTASGTMGPPSTPSRAGSISAPTSARRSIVSSMKPASRASDSPLKAASTLKSALTKPSTSTRHSSAGSDTASISASVSAAGGRTKRKTPVERRQEIAADPHCSEVEPNRAFCRTCDMWVELSAKTPYSTRPWGQHLRDAHGAGKANRKRSSHAADGEETDQDDGASTFAPSVGISASETGAIEESMPPRSEPQRRAMLKADPRVEEVRAHEVFCRDCQTWVKLHPSSTFDLRRWRTHCSMCPGTNSQPSDRVTAAERRLKLVNDSQASAVEPQRVLCKLCDVFVSLSGEGEYNLSRWDEHKTGCPSPQNTPDLTDNANINMDGAVPASSGSARPPPSSASESTTVAADGASTSPKRVTGKRAREEEDAEAAAEAPPAVRPRKETYQAPPGFWSWLAFPITTFVAGVRQGMGLAPLDDSVTVAPTITDLQTHQP